MNPALPKKLKQKRFSKSRVSFNLSQNNDTGDIRKGGMNLNDAFQSEIHLKIIAFFHENQSSIDTPRGVSTWIRKDRSRVKSALEDLVNLEILIAHRATSTTGYSYTRDEKLIYKIAKLLNKKKPT